MTEVNDTITDAPEQVNQSPERAAWFAKVRLSNPAELDGLMDRAAYDAYLKGL